MKEPEDFRLWHETMLMEFPEWSQRLLAGPMWSGLDPQDQKDPMKVKHIYKLWCIIFLLFKYLFTWDFVMLHATLLFFAQQLIY